MTLSVEKIKSNWEMYEKLCQRLSDHSINTMLEELGNRIVTCSESLKSDRCGAYAGGLVEHALSVASAMKAINDAMDLGVQTSSILRVSLLHEIGKVGDLTEDLMVDQDSDWHRENLGQMYKYNENIQKMSVSHRTLYLLQSYNINLSSEEWIAIQLSQGSHFEENRFYVGSEPTLALLLQQAKCMVIHKTSQ